MKERATRMCFSCVGMQEVFQVLGLFKWTARGVKETTVIGLYNSTQAIGGSDWMMLIYRNGEAYNVHLLQGEEESICYDLLQQEGRHGPAGSASGGEGEGTRLFLPL
uniref:Uncharacterized protein n=1 Tax=Anguilla anguilla TaxID=7936 RepID=A0A0E9PGC3_ANGAN